MIAEHDYPILEYSTEDRAIINPSGSRRFCFYCNDERLAVYKGCGNPAVLRQLRRAC